MAFGVYIQEVFIENIEASDAGEALGIVGSKFDSGEYSFDANKPELIQIVPV